MASYGTEQFVLAQLRSGSPTMFLNFTGALRLILKPLDRVGLLDSWFLKCIPDIKLEKLKNSSHTKDREYAPTHQTKT